MTDTARVGMGERISARLEETDHTYLKVTSFSQDSRTQEREPKGRLKRAKTVRARGTRRPRSLADGYNAANLFSTLSWLCQTRTALQKLGGGGGLAA